MAYSTESQAFQDIFSTLKDGLRCAIDDIADQAYSKGLIPEKVYRQVTSTHISSDSERTRIFLNAIGDRIKKNSNTYYHIAEILSETPAFKYLAEEMWSRVDSAQNTTSHSNHVNEIPASNSELQLMYS